MKNKTTGWKVPLIFSAGIIAATFIAYLLIPESHSLPDVPAELQKRARAATVDLDKEDNQIWKKAILQAATGFLAPEVKDARLQEVIGRAIAEDRLDIACAGAVMLHTEAARDETADQLLRAALASCRLLHYGICALGEKGTKSAERAKILTKRFYECEGREPEDF